MKNSMTVTCKFWADIANYLLLLVSALTIKKALSHLLFLLRCVIHRAYHQFLNCDSTLPDAFCLIK